MIILPVFANMPMFADDKRLQPYRKGLMVGIFAPSLKQAQTTFNRMRTRLTCPSAIEVLSEFGFEFSTSNGQTVALTNGSFATSVSASDRSNIEGDSYMLIICEECQDISSFKIRKSIHPMGAAYNATIVKIGTATTFKGDFYEVIERNKKDYKDGKLRLRNHFEYDYKICQKYNENYRKYVEKEKHRLGEHSDEFRMAYCVTPETKILTSDLRWVEAQIIKGGDKLIGFDENPPKRYGQRKLKETEVEDVGVIERPCYTVSLSDGTKVSCSEEHQWLVFTAGSRTKWKKTKDLLPTDRIYKVCNVWDALPINYKLGYLAGAYDGEGCICQLDGKVSQISFSQRDNVMLHKVKQYLEDYGFDYGIREELKQNQDPVYHLYIKGGKRELMRFLGSVRPERLLDNFDPNKLGTLRCSNKTLGEDAHPSVTSLEYIGVQKVIPIRTTSRTFVANGLASHNCLEWILERGMFIDSTMLEDLCGIKNGRRVASDLTKDHVVGIDVAKKGDSTVITVCEVDWEHPVIVEKERTKEYESIQYTAYTTRIKDWKELNGDDYDKQYYEIMDYLKQFKVSKIMIDATKEEGMCDRLTVNLPHIEVVPCYFTSQFKDRMYKNLDSSIKCGRSLYPCDEETQGTREYQKFVEQMGELEKNFRGQLMVCSHPARRGAHDDYCLSLNTEILTTRGFLKYNELTKDDLVAKVVNNKIEYVKPNNIIYKDYNGKMYRFKSKDLCLEVTENHKMMTRHRKSGREVTMLSQELASMPTSTRYNTVSIPVAPIQELPDYPVSDDLIKQIAWFITEGWINKSSKYNSHRYSFAQSRDKLGYDSIVDFVERMGLHPYTYTRKDGVTYWTFHEKDNKLFDSIMSEGIHRIPREWLSNLSQRQLKLLLDTLMLGDGTISRNTYHTKDHSLAQDVQELCHKLGMKASIKNQNRNGYTMYAVYIMQKDETRVKEVEEYDYTGKVWCVNVDNGFIVTRCNDKISVTGNCDSWALAVLGANDKEEEVKLQTAKENKFFNNKEYRGTNFYSRRNRFTARRR